MPMVQLVENQPAEQRVDGQLAHSCKANGVLVQAASSLGQYIEVMESSPQRVLVTGGTSGIGYEIARQYHQAGARVLAVGRNRSALQKLSDEGIDVLEADVRDAPATLIATAVARLGGLDVLINNAAIQLHDDYLSFRKVETRALGGSDGEFSAVLARIGTEIAINFTAPLHLAVAAIPHLTAKPGGCVVFVSSGLAVAPKSSAPVYCATKAGLSSFARAFRYQCEDANCGLSVVDAMLPFTDTPMTEGRGKISKKANAADVAAAIIKGASRGTPVLWIGQARLLRIVRRLSPKLAYKILRNA